MTAAGFVGLYHRAGAFGFGPEAPMQFAGWVGPDDPSIREEAKPHITRVGQPYASNLAAMLIHAWQAHLVGNLWLMPKSHWHYELHFGNRELLQPILRDIGIDPALLTDRNDGSAIEFARDERDLFRDAVRRMLEGLSGSDFLLAFIEHRTLCTIHHHQQLWWQTTDPAMLAALTT